MCSLRTWLSTASACVVLWRPNLSRKPSNLVKFLRFRSVNPRTEMRSTLIHRMEIFDENRHEDSLFHFLLQRNDPKLVGDENKCEFQICSGIGRDFLRTNFTVQSESMAAHVP